MPSTTKELEYYNIKGFMLSEKQIDTANVATIESLRKQSKDPLSEIVFGLLHYYLLTIILVSVWFIFLCVHGQTEMKVFCVFYVGYVFVSNSLCYNLYALHIVIVIVYFVSHLRKITILFTYDTYSGTVLHY